MATVDVGSIVTRFQVRDLEKQLANLERVEQKIAALEGKKVSLSVSTQGLQEAGSRVGAVQGALNRLVGAAQSVRSGLALAFKGITTPLSVLHGTMSKVSGGLIRVGDQITHMGQVAAATAFRLQLLVTPFQILTGIITDHTTDLEHGLQAIGTQTNLVGADLNRFLAEAQAAMQKTSREWAVSQADMQEALFTLISSLELPVPETALGLLDTIAKFAVLGDTSAQSIAELGVILISTFSKESMDDPIELASQFEGMISEVFLAMKEGRGTFEEFVAQMGDFARIGQQVGAELPDMLALFTVLTRTRPLNEAATQVKRIMQSLIEPKTLEHMKALGVATTEFQEGIGEIRREPFDILTDFFEALEELGPEEQLIAIGEAFPNIRAELGVLEFQAFQEDILLLAQRLDSASESFAGASKVIDEHAVRMNNTINNKISRAYNNLIILGQQILADFAVPVSSALDLIINGMTRLTQATPETRQALAKFALGISALPPLLLAVSTAILGIGGLVSAIGALVSPGVLATAGTLLVIFHDELFALKGLLADYDLTSLSGLASLVGDLTVALGLLEDKQVEQIFAQLHIAGEINPDNVERFQEAISGITNKVQTGIDFVERWVNAFVAFFDAITAKKDEIGNLLGQLDELAQAFMEGQLPEIDTSGVGEKIRTSVTTAVETIDWSRVKTAVSSGISLALTGITITVAAALSIARGLIESIREQIDKVDLERLRTRVREGVQGAIGEIDWSQVKELVTGGISLALEGASLNIQVALSIARGLIDSITEQIKSVDLEQLKSEIQGAIQGAVDEIDWSRVGEVVTTGIGVALTGISIATQTALAIAQQLVDSITNQVDNVNLKDLETKVRETIQSAVSTQGVAEEEAVSVSVTPTITLGLEEGFEEAAEGVDLTTTSETLRERLIGAIADAMRRAEGDDSFEAQVLNAAADSLKEKGDFSGLGAIFAIELAYATGTELGKEQADITGSIIDWMSANFERIDWENVGSSFAGMLIEGIKFAITLPEKIVVVATAISSALAELFTSERLQNAANNFTNAFFEAVAGFQVGFADRMQVDFVDPLISKIEALLPTERNIQRIKDAFARLFHAAIPDVPFIDIIPSPAPQAPARESRGFRHTGGYVEVLQREFVASPLTTRILEGVVGGPLNQQNMRQLAMANAGAYTMNHSLGITPGSGINIKLDAQGMGDFSLTKRQREELGWEITGIVARRFREVIES